MLIGPPNTAIEMNLHSHTAKIKYRIATIVPKGWSQGLTSIGQARLSGMSAVPLWTLYDRVEVLMEANRAFVLSWSDVLTLLVAVTGFALILRQRRFQSMGLRGEAFTVLTGLSLVVMKYIADNPELYKYFYESKELQDDDVNRVKFCVVPR